MKLHIQPASYRAIYWALIVLLLPLGVSAQREARFPKVAGANLENRRFTLPNDLQGDLNIVLLELQPTRREDLAGWLPAVREMCAATPGMRYYDVPVLLKTQNQTDESDGRDRYRESSERSAWEYTIPVALDLQSFKNSLGIVGEEALQILLIDRQGGIVWRDAGKITSEKTQALAKTAEEWRKAKGPRIETLNGKPASLSDYHGKVVLLILSGKGPSGAAASLLQEIVLGSIARRDIVYATGADLTRAPGVLRGYIRDEVKSTAGKNRQRLITALRQAGIEYDAAREPVTFLDWQGVLPRQFSVSGKTERAYQMFVLNRAGAIVFRYEQPPTAAKSLSPAPEILKALLKTAE